MSTGQPVDAVGLLPSKYDRLVVIFRDARREDVPAIVALLADDEFGAEREAAVLDEAYQVAFEQIQSDPRSRLVVAETSGQVAGTLQLSLLPGLSRHGMLRAQIEGVRVAARRFYESLGFTASHEGLKLPL